ncbi:MAG: thioesterase family protein [Firmicutes bacterium]|nr:thioesterase family protein [Bacillota bacterium]
MPFSFYWNVALPDTDAAGIVFAGRFFEWFQRAEEMMFAEMGYPYRQLFDTHFGMPAVHVEITYDSPLFLGSKALIELSVSNLTERAYTADFHVKEANEDRKVAEGHIRHRFVTLLQGKGIEGVLVEEDLKRALEKYESIS